MAETCRGIEHPFSPVWNGDCRALLLGTFPSVQSRKNAFYYGHPQNRFWRVLAALFAEEVPADISRKRALLLRHGIALWDVLASCDVTGSADASIRRPVPNDISLILRGAPIRQVFANGRTAEALYRRYCLTQTGVPITALPSTSPANARFTLPILVEAWQPLRNCVAAAPPDR